MFSFTLVIVRLKKEILEASAVSSNAEENSCSGVRSMEDAKKATELVFTKIKSLFYITNLHVMIEKVSFIGAVYDGLSQVLGDHFNSIAQLHLSFRRLNGGDYQWFLVLVNLFCVAVRI